jgi:hypothetical protein
MEGLQFPMIGSLFGLRKILGGTMAQLRQKSPSNSEGMRK